MEAGHELFRSLVLLVLGQTFETIGDVLQDGHVREQGEVLEDEP